MILLALEHLELLPGKTVNDFTIPVNQEPMNLESFMVRIKTKG